MTAPSQPSVQQAFSGLSNDEIEILAQADRFAQNELYPLAQRMDDEEWWPTDIFPKIGETGYFGVTAPEQYGGSGMDVFTSGLILQAFSRWNHALALAWVAHENLCMNNILANGSDAQTEPGTQSLSSKSGSVQPSGGSVGVSTQGAVPVRSVWERPSPLSSTMALKPEIAWAMS